MRIFFTIGVLLGITFGAVAQNKNQRKPAIAPLQEDSTELHKIIPAELPRPIVDSLQRRNFQMGDVYTAHRNETRTVYVVEVAHELVKETFWFDPKGRQLRPSAKNVN